MSDIRTKFYADVIETLIGATTDAKDTARWLPAVRAQHAEYRDLAGLIRDVRDKARETAEAFDALMKTIEVI
jgi:hypothetical protein